MKTETLTHGSFKTVREGFVIYRLCEEWEGVILCEIENSVNFQFAQRIFAKNSSSKTKTVAFKRRLSYVAVVAEDFIIKSV